MADLMQDIITITAWRQSGAMAVSWKCSTKKSIITYRELAFGFPNAVVRQLKDAFMWGRKDSETCQDSSDRLPQASVCDDLENVFYGVGMEGRSCTYGSPQNWSWARIGELLTYYIPAITGLHSQQNKSVFTNFGRQRQISASYTFLDLYHKGIRAVMVESTWSKKGNIQ